MATDTNLKGQTFGRWYVIKQDKGKKGRGRHWFCQCSCGSKIVRSISAGNLKSGNSKSCGCLAKTSASARMKERHDRGEIWFFEPLRNDDFKRMLDFVVMSYQANQSKESANIIIDMFKDFLQPYYEILSIDCDKLKYDPKVFAFYQILFSPDKKNDYTVEQCTQALNKLYVDSRAESIWNDIVMCVLTLACRYQKSNSTFWHYATHTFHFELARFLRKEINNLQTNQSVSFLEVTVPLVCQSTEYLADDWENGFIEQEALRQFKPRELKILRLYYQEGLSDREISETLGIHINTVNLSRRTVAAKLLKWQSGEGNAVLRYRNQAKIKIT